MTKDSQWQSTATGSALWTSFAVSVASLVGLVLLNQSVSSGWRLFVLAKMLKAGWAATAAMFAGIGALLILSRLLPNERDRLKGRRLEGFELLRVLTALASALSAFGYFMPDWSFWTAVFAVAVLALWALAGVSVLMAR